MTVASPQTLRLLSLLKLKGVGPAALKKVVLLPSFESRTVEDIAASVPQIARSLEGGANWSEAQDWAHDQVEAARKHNARILTAIDLEYPELLAATKDDPFILYVQGALARPGQRTVAVIGTREPTHHGTLVAKRITSHFAQADWSIVSGLAIGCDALAHETALECGAHTVAVLAHGLHMIAPSKHKRLAQDILAKGGALVSEYPFGQGVQSQQYVKRDRTQAGMSLGVVMVQSDVKGGSLYASRATLEYGRWLAVPYPTHRDLENREPKVQANLVVADGAPHERADLLRCTTSALSRVFVLRSKEDYAGLTESSGVEPFERMPSLVRHEVESEPANSGTGASDAADSMQSVDTVAQEALFQGTEAMDTPAETHDASPGDGGRAADREQSSAEADADGSDRDSRALAPQPASPKEVATPVVVASEHPADEASSEVEARELEPHEGASFQDSCADLVLRGEDGTTTVVQLKEPCGGDPSEADRQVFLYLTLPKEEAVGAAFGLLTLPKFGGKAFKQRLGDSAADDGELHEFYARHRRLQGHLAEIQRKVLDAKSPRTLDQRLALRLVAEEVVVHLSRLANAAEGIEARAAAVRQRVEAEDWIEQEAAGHQSSQLEVSSEVSESRRHLVEDLSGLLSADLKSFVIDDGDLVGAVNQANFARQRVDLHRLIQRLNSVLASAF